MARVVFEGVQAILLKLVEAGSEVAKKQLEAIDVRIKKEEAERDARPTAIYIKVPIEISAKIGYVPPLTPLLKCKKARLEIEQAELKRKHGSGHKRKVEAMQRNFAEHVFENSDFSW